MSIATLLGSIFLISLIAKDLIHESKYAPLLAVVLLMISPIFIISQGFNLDINTAFTLMIFEFLVFLRADKHFLYIILFLITSLILVLISFNLSAIVLTEVLSILLIYQNKNNKRFVIVATFIWLILLPFVLVKTYKIFNDGLIHTQPSTWLTDEQRREHGNFQGKFVVLMHNKIINNLSFFGEHYASAFSGDKLFVAGDDLFQRFAPEFGYLYLVYFFFIIQGTWIIFSNFGKYKYLAIWLLVSPFTIAATYSPVNAESILPVIPALILTATIGAVRLSIKRKFLFGILVIVLIWDFSRFLHQFLIHGAWGKISL